MKEAIRLLSADNTIGQIRAWLQEEHITNAKQRAFAVIDQNGHLTGTVDLDEITDGKNDPEAPITSILNARTPTIYEDNTLRVAVDVMAKLQPGLLPVVSREDKTRITEIGRA